VLEKLVSFKKFIMALPPPQLTHQGKIVRKIATTQLKSTASQNKITILGRLSKIIGQNFKNLQNHQK
jgi:hypothetical protein